MNDAQFFHRALFDIILFSIIQVVNKYIKMEHVHVSYNNLKTISLHFQSHL